MLVCSCKNTNKYRNKEENLGKIKKYLLFNQKEGLAHTICTSPSLYMFRSLMTLMTTLLQQRFW